jgi:hypothetical protein
MRTKALDQAYIRCGGTAVSLFSRAVDVGVDNAVSVSAVAATISQDTTVNLEGSNDAANWSSLSGSGNLTTAAPSALFNVTGVAFRFVRAVLRMSAAGSAVVSAELETSRQ